MKVKEWLKERGKDVKEFHGNHKLGIGYVIGVGAAAVMAEILTKTWYKSDMTGVQIGHFDATEDKNDVWIELSDRNKYGKVTYTIGGQFGIEKAEELIGDFQHAIEERKKIINKE